MPARRHHPTLPPSSFPAFSKCARYQSNPVVGAAAIRGTRIGATLEEMMTGQKQEEAFDPEELRYKEPHLLEEIEWTYRELETLYDGFAGLEVESEVQVLDDDFNEVTFGTADYYRAGHLADLKTGEKRSYRAQMALLSLGFMDRDGLDSMKVSLVWSKHREVETWEWSRAEVTAIVWPIIESVLRKDAPRPNDYCSWCQHRETCPARVKAVETIPLNIPTTGTLAAHLDTLTPPERAALIRRVQIAKKWCEDAEAAIEGWFLMDPEAHAIEGYKLGKSSPKRVWADEAAAAVALQTKAVELGKDAAPLFRLVGATRVKEVLGTGKGVKSLVDSLLAKPEGKPAMVEDWTQGKTPILPGEAQEETKETTP